MPVDREGSNANVLTPFFNHEQHRTETRHADSHTSADSDHQPTADESLHYRYRQDPSPQVHASFRQGTTQRHLADQALTQSADDAVRHCAKSNFSRSIR